MTLILSLTSLALGGASTLCCFEDLEFGLPFVLPRDVCKPGEVFKSSPEEGSFLCCLGTIRALESMQRLIFRMNVYHLKHPDFQRREDQRSGKFSNNNNLLGSNLASRKKKKTKNPKNPKSLESSYFIPETPGGAAAPQENQQPPCLSFHQVLLCRSCLGLHLFWDRSVTVLGLQT